MSFLGDPEKIYEIPDPIEVPDHAPEPDKETVPA